MVAEENIFAGFVGDALTARGSLLEVAVACKAQLEAGASERVAVFDDTNGRTVELDLSGTAAEVAARLQRDDGPEPVPRRPGRPKLGVVSREISLLPKQWEWLADQRLGASATLRRLVDAARKQDSQSGAVRQNIDAAHRFLWDIAGDQPNFEEATRALFASDFDRLVGLIESWPAGIRDQLMRFVDRARQANPPKADSPRSPIER